MRALSVLVNMGGEATDELTRRLGDVGFDVKTSVDGEAARPDAVVVDRYDERGRSRWADVPVLLLTSEDPDDDLVIKALADGVADVIARPVSSATLAARIRSAVEMRRLASEARDHVDELRRHRARPRQAALRDPLTEVYNDAHFAHQIEVDVARARRYGEPLTVVVLDLDGFGRVVEEHGAVAGERLLCHVADQVVASVRASDTVARLSDDSFGIILTRTTLDAARVAIERLRSALERIEPEVLPGTRVQTSACFGIVAFDAEAGGEPADLIARAVAASGAARAEGRSAVVVDGGDGPPQPARITTTDSEAPGGASMS